MVGESSSSLPDRGCLGGWPSGRFGSWGGGTGVLKTESFWFVVEVPEFWLEVLPDFSSSAASDTSGGAFEGVGGSTVIFSSAMNDFLAGCFWLARDDVELEELLERLLSLFLS